MLCAHVGVRAAVAHVHVAAMAGHTLCLDCTTICRKCLPRFINAPLYLWMEAAAAVVLPPPLPPPSAAMVSAAVVWSCADGMARRLVSFSLYCTVLYMYCIAPSFGSLLSLISVVALTGPTYKGLPQPCVFLIKQRAIRLLQVANAAYFTLNLRNLFAVTGGKGPLAEHTQ